MTVAIGIYQPRKAQEVEHLRRAVRPFEPTYTFQVGGYRVENVAGIPHIFYRNLDKFLAEGRFGLEVVALELTHSAIPLGRYEHDESVAYLLGPNTGTLPQDVLSVVNRKVYVETPDLRALDTSAVAAVVLHHRYVTLTRKAAV